MSNVTNITISCTYDFMLNASDKCAFAKLYCDSENDLADFYYCSFIDGNILYMAPIIIGGLFLAFLLLGSTADNYLTPALESLAKKFHFSETLAGVTLLAFANGAPDVLSSFSASSGNSQGIFLSLGAIFGAGLFVTTFVFARII